jgi:hypothetical protein
MSLGGFTADFLMRLFSPEVRARRKARRRARKKAKRGGSLTELEQEILMADQVTVTLPDGSTMTRLEPVIPARTSTKSLVGGTFLAQVYVQVVGFIPNEGLVSALTTPEMIALVSVALTALVARFTKSPIAPQKL